MKLREELCAHVTVLKDQAKQVLPMTYYKRNTQVLANTQLGRIGIYAL